MKRNSWWSIFASGLVLAGLSAYLASIRDLNARIPLFLVVFGVMFAAYLFALVAVSRAGRGGARLLVFIVIVAAVCRVSLLFSPPALSTDIYRYLWEGRITAAGENPFALPPAAPELEGFRDENYARINHPHMETIYPPLAQAVFLAAASIKADLTTQKILFTLFDLAALGVVILLLLERRSNPALSVVYAWSPLVIVEFSHSGHADAVGIFFLVLAVYLWHLAKDRSSAVALALSFLSKYVSALVLPFYVFKERAAARVTLFVLVAALGYLPFADAGGGLVASLGTYGREWEFNSAAWTLARAVFGPGAWLRYGLFAVVAAFSIVQGYRRRDLLRCTYLVLGCALLLTPTLYPWYLCWITPFLCFYRSRGWLYLTGAVAASYWVWVSFNRTGLWHPGGAVMAFEYVPFFALLVWDGIRARRRPPESESA